MTIYISCHIIACITGFDISLQYTSMLQSNTRTPYLPATFVHCTISEETRSSLAALTSALCRMINQDDAHKVSHQGDRTRCNRRCEVYSAHSKATTNIMTFYSVLMRLVKLVLADVSPKGVNQRVHNCHVLHR